MIYVIKKEYDLYFRFFNKKPNKPDEKAPFFTTNENLIKKFKNIEDAELVFSKLQEWFKDVDIRLQILKVEEEEETEEEEINGTEL